MKPLDRLLEALRATGPDAYRADPLRLNAWDAYCPACSSRILEVRRLRIAESCDGCVALVCSTGCSRESILNALRIAELYPNAWSRRLAAEGALAEAELDRLRGDRRIVRAIQREAR